MAKLILACSKEARLRTAIRRQIERLGGKATAKELHESYFHCFFPKYQGPKGLKAFVRKLNALVDEGVLECQSDEEDPMVDIYSIAKR